ncbi:transposase [Lactiplantibacillus plantarum]|uniref:transposase n=1 Tax=Lactiplantibacillus plantarum TaxID=1590 RepID=UPI000930A781|nr:transposase [Lactiplantibacillus plantarum]
MNSHNALQQTFPVLEHLFVSRISKLTLNVIGLFPHLELVSGLSQTKLKNILMKSIDKRISKVKVLRKAPELLHFASELGDTRRFSNNHKLNAYIGIDLNRYQSSTYTHQDHISKRGDTMHAVFYSLLFGT